MKMKTSWCVVGFFALSMACGDPAPAENVDEQNQSDNQAPDNQNGEPTYTYYEHAKPLIDARCTGCHIEGNIGGFDLTSYQGVFDTRLLNEAVLREETMPPWLAAEGCADYEHSFQLSSEERALLLTWFEEGAPEGDPAEEAPPLETSLGGLSRVDVELSMAAEYEPRLKPDDYRCFVMDWEEEGRNYITGFNVIPGNPEIVHHVIAFYAPPSRAAEVEALEASEEGMGYTCFGTPGVGSDGLGGGDVSWLGSWAPGGMGVDFPQDTGIQVDEGGKIIVQVHYNTYEGESPTDRSTVQFSTERTVEKPARYQPFSNFAWIANPSSMLIPAGDPEVEHRFGLDLASFAQRDIRVHSVNLHMHLLGTSGRLWIDRGNDNEDCLLDVPRWDFNWQHEYRFSEPRLLERGDQLWISCTFDNSAENQPVIQGERIEPRDVGWGDGTTDEMCLGILYVTFE